MKGSNIPKKDNAPKRGLNGFIVKLAIALGIALGNPNTNTVIGQNAVDKDLVTFVNKNYKPGYDSSKFLREKDYVGAYRYQLEGLSVNYLRNLMEFPQVFKIGSMESIRNRKQFYDLSYQTEPRTEEDHSGLNVSTKGKDFITPTHFIDIQVDYSKLLEEYKVNQKLQQTMKNYGNSIGLYIDGIDIKSQVFIRIFLYDDNYTSYLQDLVNHKVFHLIGFTSYSTQTHRKIEPLTVVLPVEESTTNGIELSYQKQESSSNVLAPKQKKINKSEMKVTIKNTDASNSVKDVNVGRKWFVAYGRRVDHSQCRPGAHQGSGHQSQNCGKTVKTKSYHRADTGKEMTNDEVSKYVGSDN